MAIDLSQFHQTFFEESFEGLDAMESGLLNLAPGSSDLDAVNAIFRVAHSIKGGAATFGFQEVTAFTHVMETLLDGMRSGTRTMQADSKDVLLQSVDCLRAMLTATRDHQPIDLPRVQGLQAGLEALLGQTPGASAAKAANEEASGGAGWRIRFRPLPQMYQTGNDPTRMFRALEGLGSLRVEADTRGLPGWESFDPEQAFLGWNLELKSAAPRKAVMEVFEWVEGDCELEVTPLAGASPAAAAPVSAPTPVAAVPAAAAPAAPEAARAAVAASSGQGDGSSIRVGIDKIDALINMVGELVITQSMLSQLSENFDISRLPTLLAGLTQLERNTRELQESVMRIRMLPISFVFNRFPRMVHDLSQKLSKKIELQMSGEGTELDKTVLEKIGDPLVHLVRNSLDHGIERPEVRRAAGKRETGTVHLNAYHQSGNIIIEITDDGAGINKEKLLSKARERGLVADDKAPLDDKAIFDLIFHPGLSTAEQLSDVSGRGVGMDVVRKNIKAVGGTVDVQSQQGVGTTITIRLPLTLAILDGQTVRVGEETYIIPLVSIVESIKVKNEMVNMVAGKGEVIRLRDEYLQVLRLYQVFQATPTFTSLEDGLLVVVEGEGNRACFFVDELLGQQQIVIKSLEANFKRVEGVSGATILGDGTVSLILDIPGLIQLAHRNPPSVAFFQTSAAA